jgi:hypothetical protein
MVHERLDVGLKDTDGRQFSIAAWMQSVYGLALQTPRPALVEPSLKHCLSPVAGQVDRGDK